MANASSIEWPDAMLAEDDLSNIGRFLWWVENAPHDGLSASQLQDLRRAAGAIESLEADLEGAG